MPKAYIAGPMSGYEQFNFPMFDKVRDFLFAKGWHVISPADLDRELDGFDPVARPNEPPPPRMRLKDYMARDLPVVATCDTIVLLPGWEHSMGANLELEKARKCGLKVYQWAGESPMLGLVEDAVTPRPNHATLKRAHEMMELETKEEQERMAKEGATKHYSAGKPLVQDIPYSLKYGIGHILRWAMDRKDKPYPRHNWRKGIAWSEFVGSAIRHIEKWKDGEDLDEESGLSHLWHAATNLMFLIEYEAKKLGTDDRWKGTTNEDAE